MLSADRNTITRPGERYEFPVAANTTIYAGALVALNASGLAVPAEDAGNLTVVGYALEQVANGAVAGELLVKVSRNEAQFDAADTIELANVGSTAYVVTDSSVAITSAAATFTVPVGVVTDVDEGGVWVGFQYGLN